MCSETESILTNYKSNKMFAVTITTIIILTFVIGFVCGARQTRYVVKKVNLTTRFTFDEIIEFVGGSPQRKTILKGTKRTAVILTDGRKYLDECKGNTIYYCGLFHTTQVSPAHPGHQSIEYGLNKHLNEYRDNIHIFVKIRSNEYVLIGTGKRVGKYKKIMDGGKEVLIFPIRYMCGNLKTVTGLLTPPSSPRSPRSPRSPGSQSD